MMLDFPNTFELMVSFDFNRLGSILLMLVFISVLIIAHEMGHFWVARWCGVKVERFGFGLPFGPTLWSKKIGDVEYCIHAALFGGYVAFPDDNPDNPLPKDSPERFENKPLWARFAVMIAGVTVNAVLGWVLMTAVLLGWGLSSTEAAVGRVAQGHPAYQAGLVSGDRIVAVNNVPVEGKTGEDRVGVLQAELSKYKNTPVTLTVMRPYAQSGQLLYADVIPEKSEDFKATRTAIKQAQIEQDDMERVKKAAKAQAQLIELNRKPAFEKKLNLAVTPDAEGRIGISLAQINEPVHSPLEASIRSADYLTGMIQLQFMAFGRMFQGKMNMQELSGPISIVNVGSDQIQKNGIQRGLMLTAIISVILAVMNLLPIPALDGGHIFFLLIEAIKGSPVKQEFREQVTQIGFLGLLGLIAFILLNDINNTFINPTKLP